LSTTATAPPLKREPVGYVVGALGALLMWLVTVIPGLPDDAETILQALTPAVLGVLASLKTASVSKPTVWLGGIIAGIFTALVGFGVEVPQEQQLAIQEAVLLVVTYLTRQNTVPEVPGPGTST
jgi:hypothetical protein